MLRENGELVLENDNAFYGCMFKTISYLHYLQNYINDYCHFDLIRNKNNLYRSILSKENDTKISI